MPLASANRWTAFTYSSPILPNAAEEGIGNFRCQRRSHMQSGHHSRAVRLLLAVQRLSRVARSGNDLATKLLVLTIYSGAFCDGYYLTCRLRVGNGSIRARTGAGL